MLRRLSDVTIGSIEKILNIGGGGGSSGRGKDGISSEKKRKFKASECEEEEEDNFVDKENQSGYGLIRLRKSKGHWDISTTSEDFSDSSDIESIKIDLDDIDSSEIPTDLSINEEEWTDYLITEQLLGLQSDSCWILKDSDNTDNTDKIESDEIYKSMKFREQRGKISGKEALLKNHPDLTHLMRAKLINWIFEVGIHYKLQRETIYSTQILLDTFLSLSQNKGRTKLQLIGLSCLLISSKLEEVRPPNLTDLSMICDEMFGKKEIASMELEICSTLKWFLTPVNSLNWLKFYESMMKRCKKLTTTIGTGTGTGTGIGTGTEIEVGTATAIGRLDFLIHSSRILDFSSSKLAAALIAETCENISILEKCTGYKITEIQEELEWINSWKDFEGIESGCGSIAYVDPKLLKLFTDDQFDEVIKNHRKSLNFIIKKIKLE